MKSWKWSMSEKNTAKSRCSRENSEKRILAGQNMLAALSVFNQTEEMKVRLVYVPYLLNKADPVTIDLSGRKGRLFRISVEE